VLTLPKPIREKYHLREGDVLTLIDLDGVLLLSLSSRGFGRKKAPRAQSSS